MKRDFWLGMTVIVMMAACVAFAAYGVWWLHDYYQEEKKWYEVKEKWELARLDRELKENNAIGKVETASMSWYIPKELTQSDSCRIISCYDTTFPLNDSMSVRAYVGGWR